jgi:hypothetical protein
MGENKKVGNEDIQKFYEDLMKNTSITNLNINGDNIT